MKQATVILLDFSVNNEHGGKFLVPIPGSEPDCSGRQRGYANVLTDKELHDETMGQDATCDGG